jgi:hypothetical protein
MNYCIPDIFRIECTFGNYSSVRLEGAFGDGGHHFGGSVAYDFCVSGLGCRLGKNVERNQYQFVYK